jgi:hypothetical protein
MTWRSSIDRNLLSKVKIKTYLYITVFNWEPNYLFSLKIFFSLLRDDLQKFVRLYYFRTIITDQNLYTYNSNNLLPCRHRMYMYQWAQGWEVYYKALTHCIQPLKTYGVKFSLCTPGRQIGVEVQLHSFLILPLDGGEWLFHAPDTLLTYVLTFSMEQCPSWEANRFSAS